MTTYQIWLTIPEKLVNLLSTRIRVTSTKIYVGNIETIGGPLTSTEISNLKAAIPAAIRDIIDVEEAK